ncbi:class I SAM-dependent methyltransferase [Paenibacillus filicis]|uniref:Class I SAM-dependent methyltransferase n=1 Tax=Paenibacillus filicis TaxID=669464 RepID=A0ABU9DH75_9BACL
MDDRNHQIGDKPRKQTEELNVGRNEGRDASRKADRNVDRDSDKGKETGSPSRMSWNGPHADGYEHSISRKIPGYEQLYEQMDRLLAAILEEQGETSPPRLLVVGAGGGQELVTLGTRHPEWRLTGIDPSAPMREMAQRRIAVHGLAGRISLLPGTVDHLPASDPYDAVTCMLVLHFVQGNQEKLALLKSISEKLKPGMPLFLASINGVADSPPFALQMKAWKRHMLDNGIPLEDWERFEASIGVETDPVDSVELEELLLEAGFEQLSRFFGSFLIEGYFALKRVEP